MAKTIRRTETAQLHVAAVEGLLGPFDGLLASLDSSVGLPQHDNNPPQGRDPRIESPTLRIVGWTDEGRHY
jgi:hypothetical protein